MDKIELYNYLNGLLQFLANELQKRRMLLSKQPGHFLHISQTEKIKHDMDAIAKKVDELRPEIVALQNERNKEIEDMLGIEFRFLQSNRAHANSPLVAVKGEGSES